MAIDPFDWTCPHCNKPQVVTNSNYDEKSHFIMTKESIWGDLGYVTEIIICSSIECKMPTVKFSIYKRNMESGYLYLDYSKNFFLKQLIPDGNYKSYPDYIPLAIREDYQESCLIRDLSPKASATLARRCLQGMIRDFCQISKKTLDQEIRVLKDLVDQDNAPKGVSHESVDAIDHVRTVGNIGAHMEKDVDHIVPVEPQEAQMLIDLIESLFDEWYIARHKRQERFSGLKALADQKKALKTGGNAAGSPPVALPAPESSAD